MSLHEVLLATRDIILESPNLPETIAEREVFLRNRFPALTAGECADFAKIEPTRWQIYTKSIFIGERELFKKRFPLTFALLHRHYEAIMGKAFRPHDFIFSLSRKRPWRTNKNFELFSNFRDHIAFDLPQVTAKLPFLPDVTQLELDRYWLARHVAETFRMPEQVSFETLRTLTVAELLTYTVILNPAQLIRQFRFDVPRYHRQFRNAGDRLPEYDPGEISAKDNLFALGCRDHAHRIQWRWISAGTQKFFDTCVLEGCLTISVERYAEAFLAGTSYADEACAFEAFIGELTQLQDSEAIACVK